MSERRALVPATADSHGRVRALDILKAIAISLMVIGHVIQGLTAAQVMSAEDPVTAFNHFVYRFHMHAFFFASGAVMALHQPPEFRALVGRRAATLYYPHVLWGAFYYVVAVVFVGYYNTPIQDPGDISRHAIEILAGQKSWFLPTLFAVTVLIWPLLRRLPAATLLVALGLALWPLQADSQVVFHFPRFAVFFVAGYLAIDGLLRLTERLCPIHLCMIGGLLVGVLLLPQPFTPQGIAARLQDMAFGLVGVLALWAFSATLAHGPKLAAGLGWLGGASLAMFLLHPLASGAVRAILLAAWPQASPLLLVALISAAGIGLPALAFAVANRLKLRWLFVWPFAPRRRDQPNPAR
jgi:fucose 4-O-acetylase-like acetyltransferase